MSQITFITADDTRYNLDATDGESMMQTATNNMVPGIIGECGGSAACATCHVYVAEAWIDRLPPASEMERDLLTIVSDLRPNSRLSCQIEMKPELDGLVLHVPVDSY